MKNNTAFDKALDTLIEEAAMISAENEGNISEIGVSDVQFSYEHEKRMKKLFNKEKQKNTLRKISKFSKIAACVLVAFTVAGGICIMSVEAWRHRAMNFIEDLTGRYSSVDFGNDNVYYGKNGVTIEYLPVGFELSYDTSTDSRIELCYENEETYFTISVGGLNGTRRYDTEDANVEKTMVNGNEAICISEDHEYILLWSDSVFVYDICGNIPLDMIFKIAESIKR